MIDERFSAYLDGEASPEEAEAVVSELGRNPELRAAWGRQHWFRSVLREADASVDYDPAFPERVRRVLEADAPATAKGDRIVPFRHRRRWSTAAGLAAAASVVGVMLLAPGSLGPGDGEGGPTTTVITDSTATTATIDTADIATVADARQSADQGGASDAAIQDRLNGYLLEHNGLARGYGLSGATPTFLRVATHGQDTNR